MTTAAERAANIVGARASLPMSAGDWLACAALVLAHAAAWVGFVWAVRRAGRP